MPHYRDGTEARIGDRCRGPNHGHNSKPVEGIIVSITPGTNTCNAQVAFPTVLPVYGDGPKIPVVTLVTGYATLSELERVEPAN